MRLKINLNHVLSIFKLTVISLVILTSKSTLFGQCGVYQDVLTESKMGLIVTYSAQNNDFTTLSKYSFEEEFYTDNVSFQLKNLTSNPATINYHIRATNCSTSEILFDDIYHYGDVISLNNFSGFSCLDPYVFTVFHTDTLSSGDPATYEIEAKFTEEIQECPVQGDIFVVSNPLANATGEICADSPPILVDVFNLNLINGQPYTFSSCEIFTGSQWNLIGNSDTIPIFTFGKQGIFDPDTIPGGNYVLEYKLVCGNSNNYTDVFRLTKNIRIFKPSFAQALAPFQTKSCVEEGDFIDLYEFLDPLTTKGGVFKVNNEVIQGHMFEPTFQIYPYFVEYSYFYPSLCGLQAGAVSTSFQLTVDLIEPVYVNMSGPSSICVDPDNPFTLSVDSPMPFNSNFQQWILYKKVEVNDTLTTEQVYQVDICNSSGQSPNLNYQVPSPLLGESDSYVLEYRIYTKENCTPASDACFSSDQFEFTLFNNGACGTSTCEEIYLQMCPIESAPDLKFGCSVLSIEFNLIELVNNYIYVEDNPINCDDPSATVKFSDGLFTINPQYTSLKVEDLPVLKEICNAVGFDIFGWRPLGFLYDFMMCNSSLGQAVASFLTKAAQGDGGKTIIMADTDSDGAFDWVGYDDIYPMSSPIQAYEIPNNVKGNGKIGLRIVSAFPSSPAGVCGDINNDGKTLTDILPLSFIPVVGDVIEEAIQVLGCNTELQWSNHKSDSVMVFNTSPPEFINCPDPTTVIVISEDYSCNTEPYWSIPTAIDGCGGDVLSNYDSEPTGSGVWQTGGVAIGDELDAGEYTATYTAKACNQLQTTCTINISVDGGDPVLIAPENLVIPTNYGYDNAVVTGIGPLSGAGCGTTITYTGYDINDAIVFSGSEDASGHTFELGQTRVVYEMTYENASGATILGGTDEFTVNVVDETPPVPLCGYVEKQLDNEGNTFVTALEMDALSYDNVTENIDLLFEISSANNPTNFTDTIPYDCLDKDVNYLNLKVTDENGNSSTCIATVKIIDFFEDFTISMDLPELCLEATNPSQLDFSSYLNITNTTNNEVFYHDELYQIGPNVNGQFHIAAFNPDSTFNDFITKGTSPDSPGTTGYIDPNTGQYTPGTGSGMVSIAYILYMGDSIVVSSQGFEILNCNTLAVEGFELKQPLDLPSPACVCGDYNYKFVDLGTITGGLEPYTIQYTGGQLDLDENGTPDDLDGEYIYNTEQSHIISDYKEDLGVLLMNYSTNVWSITIVDARGCEIFKSESCDNYDVIEAPTITCPQDIGVVYTDPYDCTSLQSFTHPDIFTGSLNDNCVVESFIYYIKHSEGISEGPYDLQPLLNVDANGNLDVDPELYEAEHNFGQGVSTVHYYTADVSGNMAECTFTVTVEDNLDPVFINCPIPEINVTTEVNSCYAYVNFSLPLAEDNCDEPTVVQIDDTGLSSGSAFPQGTTVMTWEASDISGNTETCSITVNVFDEIEPTAICQDVTIQLNDEGEATIYSINSGTPGEIFIDANSWDNCQIVSIEIAKYENGAATSPYSTSQDYDCEDIGVNQVELLIVDSSNNTSSCLSNVTVLNFFDGVQLALDAPEICLADNNATQYDLTNYLVITLPDGTVISHQEVADDPFFGAAIGSFGITIYDEDPAYPGTSAGTISPDGIYTPGDGSGFVTFNYSLTIPGSTPPQNGNDPVDDCMLIVHETFELRQALDMGDPMCLCGDFTERTVELGVLSHGLEPYTIYYEGTRLDVNGDGIYDDTDGEYTYNQANGHDEADFQEDLGILRVDYTQPTWSITVVDARGCTIARSGSCDNDDASEAPSITCPDDIGVVFTDYYVCTSNETWLHPDILSGGIYDNCMITEYNFTITNPDGTIQGPFDLDPLLNIYNDGTTNVDVSLFDASYDFPQGVTTVFYYVEDATGNFMECTFNVTVEDNLDPIFINCPYPPVVENTETDHCDAYVNFALPLAEDNCDVPTVLQIDNTGLTSGDRFPAGTTIMYWEATDLSGNKDTCQVKVIVNDYWNIPEIVCPEDVLQTTDDWRCDAVVYNIDADISSICQENLSLTYEIFADEDLTDRIACGVGDASGEIFDKGDTWVKYNVSSQPLLLISEISQGSAIDQLEIVNLGPASIDINCLEVVRTSLDPNATETLPMVTNLPALTPTVLASGDVMVFDFSYDASETTPACYAIQYMGNVIDQVAVNGSSTCNNFTGVLNGGNVYRHCEADTDDANDWAVEENCALLTIGLLNPTLDALPDNGTITSLQSEPASSSSCSFKVTILDDENPFCGELDPNTNVYSGDGLTDINENQCNQSTIDITDACIIGQMSLDLSGTVDVSNADITLISPEGDRIPILSLPYDLFDDLYTIKSEGIWTLDIAPTGSGSFTLDSWSLEIICMNPFEMDDVVLSNDPGECGAQFDWTHPWFVDNCIEGSISVEYLTDDAACAPENNTLTGFGGYDESQFFCVGTTTVLYTLVDEAGNDHQCSFEVTVNDTEAPVVECPADMIFNLDGGLCDITVCYEPVSATDNCAVVDTIYSIEPCTAFDIGLHTIDITILDEAGNSDMCSFTIEVIEYVPNPYVMACNDLVNVSLGADCLEELDADMLLEGNNYHCYDDYEITITDMFGAPIPNSPFVDVSDVGENFLVMVYDPDSDNFCWSEIHVQDYNNPQVECPADITVKCFDSTDESATGSAVLISCEASVDWTVNDEFINLDNCDHIISQIIRTFTAEDESGNTGTCSHTISTERILLGDVQFPDNFDGLSNPIITCGDLNQNPDLTDPDYTGRPSAFGQDFADVQSCGLSIFMMDQDFNLCGNTYDILRTWSVYDPCLPAVIGINPIQYLQVIKVQDNAAALIECPDDIEISVDGGIGCTATYLIPEATINDACSDYEVITSTIFGSTYSNGGLLTNIPRGTFEINYQVIDECGNTNSCEYNLTVVDALSPDMVCIQQKEVVLNSGGIAITSFDVYDNGSHDNCCLESLEVARMDDLIFGESIEFDCSDDIVMVILRGTDCYGNSNQCMTEVDVEDKFNPIILCPSNTVIDCNIYYEDYGAELDAAQQAIDQNPGLSVAEAFEFLNEFGTAEVTDNCDATLGLEVSFGVDQCGEGDIIRTWNATDPSGNNAIPCTQIISIEHQSSWSINFPENWEGELQSDCTVPDPEFGEAVVSDDDCEMIAVSYDDEVFLTTNIGCYKILRTWTAINWCTYDGNSIENAILISAGDNSYSVAGSDFVTHVQTLDIYDTEAPVIEDSGIIALEIIDGCAVDFTAPDPVVLGECSSINIQVNSSDLSTYGSSGSYENVPEGTYSLTYEVSDDCGNIAYHTTDVVITDGKKPTPYCIDQLVVEIMPDGNGNGMAMVNAADFDAGSFDNCTDQSDLILSLSSDITQSTQEFDCSNVGIQTIELHVWDEAGNVDFCLVSLDIQDNMDVCAPGSLTVAGTLITEMDEAVESATIQINGGLFTAQSVQDGSFEFDQLPTGGDYSIIPELDIDADNGVTTFDIVLITKHILGTGILDSPYKIIAADANNSGSVSTLDIVFIRKVILNIDMSFPNNTSWRFIDSNFNFSDPTNPWITSFPEVVNFNNMLQDTEANFIGIKVGDVNGSAQSHSLIPAEELDGEHPFIIQTEEQKLIKGKTYSVNLKADQVTMGFQFTLNFDSEVLRYIGTDSRLMNEEHIGLSHIEYGAITCSWNDDEEQILDNEELISFEFEALKDGLLSDMISINSRITKAEAYSSSYPLQVVELMIGDALADNIELYQNVPNPFKGQTRVNFYLPDHSEATLSVRDLNGKLVAEYSADFSKGNNTLIIKDIPKGVFYYTLSVDRYLITRKMVKL